MKRLALIAVLAFGGCKSIFNPEPETEIVTVTKLVQPDEPAECTDDKSALKWVNPPEGFEAIDDIGRRERLNKDHHEDLLNDSAACSAGIKAMKQKGKSNG